MLTCHRLSRHLRPDTCGLPLRYSIIIPAYNESQRITATLDKVLAHIAQEKWDAEVLVVNDGSRDSTADIIRGYATKHSVVRLVENPGNRGKGYSVRNGMQNAQGAEFVELLNSVRATTALGIT